MSNREVLADLARAGLSTAAQRELLATLSNTFESCARYFPSSPRPYSARAKQFLMSAYCPRKGPLLITADPSFPPERLSRSQAWQIAHLELPLFDGSSRPVNELHIVLSDVVGAMVRNEFPLTVPPRWISELFEVLGRALALKMEANQWSMIPPPNLDFEFEAYAEAALKNIANDQRRSQGPRSRGLEKYYEHILPGMMRPSRMDRVRLAPFQTRIP